MTSLADFRLRAAQVLLDPDHTIYSTSLIDEALHQAVDEYSQAFPLTLEVTLTLSEGGNEIDLSGLDGLLDVTEVWWPWDPAAQTWPPPRVRGFRLCWNGTVPMLFLDLEGTGDARPKAGDQVRVWYAGRHTIMDGASAAFGGPGTSTTIPALHEGLLVRGAAGLAASSHFIDLLDAREIQPGVLEKARQWAESQLAGFRVELEVLRCHSARGGPAWTSGWLLDDWEEG